MKLLRIAFEYFFARHRELFLLSRNTQNIIQCFDGEGIIFVVFSFDLLMSFSYNKTKFAFVKKYKQNNDGNPPNRTFNFPTTVEIQSALFLRELWNLYKDKTKNLAEKVVYACKSISGFYTLSFLYKSS